MSVFNLDSFIAESVTGRSKSIFAANSEQLSQEIEGRSVCVIGGAGSIGSSFKKLIIDN